ncbi:MAG: HAD-IB family hydrolase [Pseudomonadota bacterium]
MSTPLKSLLTAIDEAPDGPQICAIFDFDGTIISGYSAIAFIREQLRRGDLSAREFVELTAAMTSFGLGNISFSGMMTITTQFMRGIEEETYVELGEDLFTRQISRLVYPESRKLIQAHQRKGHTVAIISSATPYQVEPAAADLGIENVLCTQVEVENGKFTGSVIRPTCFGQGKVDAAEVLAESVNADLDDGFFYSDSTDDQLLLERIGNPVALNPSSKLRAVAKDYNWPAADFGSRGRPTLNQYVRSVAATISLVPTFMAGLPIYALTGSRRDATNFSISLFAETASALINLDLKVRGEEHIWSNRPAVFIFNHQSKADVVICAKLLRRDMAGVGKQEIKKMPVIGKVLELGGVVMIDRKNASSAIEAMRPLVDAMRDEGKSVALAPEGTRTVSPNLAPFKKGAFHLAIQAGVPMVPIVIHNAGDVAPKGDFVFRPARVEVDVLPPVDTSDWSPETIDDHVREVRNMFLRTLRQPEEPAPAAEQAPARVTRKSPPKASSPAKRRKTSPVAGAATSSPSKVARKKPKVKSKTTPEKTVQKKAQKKAPAKARKKSVAAKATTAGKKASPSRGAAKIKAKTRSAPRPIPKSGPKPRPKPKARAKARPKNAAS